MSTSDGLFNVLFDAIYCRRQSVIPSPRPVNPTRAALPAHRQLASSGQSLRRQSTVITARQRRPLVAPEGRHRADSMPVPCWGIRVAACLRCQLRWAVRVCLPPAHRLTLTRTVRRVWYSFGRIGSFTQDRCAPTGNGAHHSVKVMRHAAHPATTRDPGDRPVAMRESRGPSATRSCRCDGVPR